MLLKISKLFLFTILNISELIMSLKVHMTSTGFVYHFFKSREEVGIRDSSSVSQVVKNGKNNYDVLYYIDYLLRFILIFSCAFKS